MEKRWVKKGVPSQDNIDTISSSLNVNSTLATLLAQRGICSFEDAKSFFRPSLDQLHDPFLMKDMEKGVNRLCEAIFGNEKILIYGDYDVDGTTSVSLVFGFLKGFTENIDYYIPDRYNEGYGISRMGVEWAGENGFSLIISLDCGIRAVENTALANELGIDLIICDHHLPGDVLPGAYAILDPKQADDNYPFKELSGCGVGFKLLQGFCIQNTIPIERLYGHLDLVAVSIASDIVPIVGENRTLAHYGLKKLNQSPSKGLESLIEISGIKPPIGISDVVFYLGPRINAAGRLTHAKESVKLLLAESENDLMIFSDHLNAKNSERKKFDSSITTEALDMIESDDAIRQGKSTVLFKEDWHKGVIGIVASRCIESYYRPTIILTESKGMATGSARSVVGFDVHEAISACDDLLEQYGGHKYAAGLTLKLDNVGAFRKRFEEVVSATIDPELLIPQIEVDLEIGFDFIDFKSFGIINQMAPFGPQNLQPVFYSKEVKCKDEPRILKDKHLKLTVYQESSSQTFDAIGFGLGHHGEKIKNAESFQIAYHIDENNFRGNKTLQLMIKDIKFD
ncbi:MAG: single-stranded-DNA-specific exonuclease RecJ [Cyclobacteriaceae bacterium]